MLSTPTETMTSFDIRSTQRKLASGTVHRVMSNLGVPRTSKKDALKKVRRLLKHPRCTSQFLPVSHQVIAVYSTAAQATEVVRVLRARLVSSEPADVRAAEEEIITMFAKVI